MWHRQALRYAGPSLLLLAFWLAMTGRFDGERLLVGVVVVALVLGFNRELILRHGEARVLGLARLPRLFTYLCQLMIDVIKANLHVAYVVLHPRLPIQPCMVILRTVLQDDVTRTMLANSITLTPGTLTVDLEGDRFLVHGLTRVAAASVEQRLMEDRLAAMEGRWRA